MDARFLRDGSSLRDGWVEIKKGFGVGRKRGGFAAPRGELMSLVSGSADAARGALLSELRAVRDQIMGVEQDMTLSVREIREEGLK